MTERNHPFLDFRNFAYHIWQQLDLTMNATPRDNGEAFKRIVRAQKNPHNIGDQFRLQATQYDGTEWDAGWRLGRQACQAQRKSEHAKICVEKLNPALL